MDRGPRRAGEPGEAPRDIDVLVVGSTPRAALAAASEEASRRLHREVNITRISPAVWDAGRDPFVKTLTTRPLTPILLGRNDDAGQEAG
jgi:hypothetical protein